MLSNSNLKKIYESAYSYDAVKFALRCLSDKLDGYEGYGDSFDVSYQGTMEELMDEVVYVLQQAGLDVRRENLDGSNTDLVYENDGVDSHISFCKIPDEYFTFTDNSHAYGISTEEWYY